METLSNDGSVRCAVLRATERIRLGAGLAGTMGLQIGERYSRREIHRLVGGGDLQSYLPHAKGRILCGCFDPELNRRAPCEIDVGNGPKVLKCAQLLAREHNEIPVFLKRRSNGWEFVGRFRATGYSEDPPDSKSDRLRRADAVAVLYLEKVLG